MKTLLVIFLAFTGIVTNAQVKIGDNAGSINASALFEMESTGKGLLIPRLTTAQRIAMLTPAKGLMVFDNTTSGFWFYNGNAWTEIKSDSSAIYIKDKIVQVTSDSNVRPAYYSQNSQYTGPDHHDLFAASGKLYVAAGTLGIRVFHNITNGAVNSTSYHNTPGIAKGVHVTGNYLYVADSDSLRIMNTSTHARVGAVAVANASKVFELNGIAYVACGTDGLKLVNVNNPAAPAVIATFNSPDYAQDVFVSGNHAYIADGSSLQIINISNPLVPVFTGSFAGGNITDVFVSGNTGYLTNNSYLNIINISNPATPVLSGAVTDYANAGGIVAEGNKVYHAGSDGLYVYDVSTPATPEILNIAPGNISGGKLLAISGNYAFAASEYGDIQSFRIKGTANNFYINRDTIQFDGLSGNGTGIVMADQEGKLSKPSYPSFNAGAIFTNSHIYFNPSGLYIGSSYLNGADQLTIGEAISIDPLTNNVVIDPYNFYPGTLDNGSLKFGGAASTQGISSNGDYPGVYNYKGLNFYTNNLLRLAINNAGAVSIDPGSISDGSLTNGLRFGGITHGEGITSKKTGGGNANGLDFFTAFNPRMSITNSGNIGIATTNPQEKLEVAGNAKVSGNLTVQNDLIVHNVLADGKGVVRSNSVMPLKMSFKIVNVNVSLTAGTTTSISFTWSETFNSSSMTPAAYVGSVTGGSGGWAEVVMTIAEVTATGGKLYVYNPRSMTANPNFSIYIIGIGR